MNKFRIPLIASLLSLALVVTISPLKGQTLNNIPAGLITFDTSEKLPTGSAIPICSAGTVAVVRTSGTVLTIGSSASSANPQSVRFGFKTRQITASATVTISSGSSSGKVVIYGMLDSSDNLVLKALNTTANVLTGSGITVVASSSSDGVTTAAKGVKLYEYTITSGAYPVSSGTDFQVSKDCWIERITISNTTASAVTITVTDGYGSAALLSGVSLAANSSFVMVDYGTIFFDQGLKITTSAANSTEVKVRGGRKF